MRSVPIIAALLLLATGGSLAGTDHARAEAGSKGATPVAVELFTSQGCSSCPPADRLAAQLNRRAGLVVISRPVTYWDRLGWKDTLGDPANTDLQRADAARGLAGQNGVFTPQMVVDGRAGATGSDSARIAQLIRSERAHAHPRLQVESDGRVVVSGKAAGEGTLSLVAVERSATVAIGRGENAARRITYTNIWLGQRDLGTWHGGTQAFTLPKTRPAEGHADRYALILRDGETGPIRAARWL